MLAATAALVPSTSLVNVSMFPSTTSAATAGPTNVIPSSRAAAFTRAGKSGPVLGYPIEERAQENGAVAAISLGGKSIDQFQCAMILTQISQG